MSLKIVFHIREKQKSPIFNKKHDLINMYIKNFTKLNNIENSKTEESAYFTEKHNMKI